MDAAIPAQQLDPIRQTILQVDGVKVYFFRIWHQWNLHMIYFSRVIILLEKCNSLCFNFLHALQADINYCCFTYEYMNSDDNIF